MTLRHWALLSGQVGGIANKKILPDKLCKVTHLGKKKNKKNVVNNVVILGKKWYTGRAEIA
jgi:hypothetical protein